MKVSAVIAAGGAGTRMGTPEGKMFVEIGGKPVLLHTIKAFDSIEIIGDIIVCLPAKDITKVGEMISRENIKKPVQLVEGGPTRQASVHNGLLSLSPETEMVVIHDGARPFVTKEIVINSISEAKACGAVIVGVPVKDTIKTVTDDKLISNTLQRDRLWSVQTPQTFKKALITEAHEEAKNLRINATDDAALVERLGARVKMIMGSYENIKITTPEDVVLGEAILRSRQ